VSPLEPAKPLAGGKRQRFSREASLCRDAEAGFAPGGLSGWTRTYAWVVYGPKRTAHELSVPMDAYTARAVVVVAPRFPENFRDALATSGLGVRGLAQAAGLDKGTVSAWSRGRTRVEIQAVEKAARQLGVTTEALLDMRPGQTHAKAALAASPAAEVLESLAALASQLAASSAATPALLDVLGQAAEVAAQAKALLRTGE
jgi:hypothetical protein